MTQYTKIDYIDPNSIKIHPKTPNVRSSVTKTACAELMRSIKENGVQAPIVAFQDNGGTYLVSGERRLNSVKWLMEEDPTIINSIPVIIKDFGKDFTEKVMFSNLSENINRADLNPLDTANRIKLLLDKGIGKLDLCKHLGKSISWLNMSLKILEAEEEVQAYIKSGDLTFDETRKLGQIEPEKQVVIAKGLVDAKHQIAETGSPKAKEAKKKIKKGLSNAVRTRSREQATKKEITCAKNTITEILKAMGVAGDKNSKQHNVLSGAYMVLSFVLGETKDLSLNKFINKYKLDLDSKGNLKPPTKKITKIKKGAAKKK